MIDAGLLNEVYNIYNPNADYTRGLKQAIGVREFEEFLGCYLSNPEACYSCNNRNDYESSTKTGRPPADTCEKLSKSNLKAILDSDNNKLKILLSEAIDRLKANTRRLVRRQVSPFILIKEVHLSTSLLHPHACVNNNAK